MRGLTGKAIRMLFAWATQNTRYTTCVAGERMTTLLQMFQQQDGAGSWGRGMRTLLLVAILAPAVYAALKAGTPVALDMETLGLIGVVAGWHAVDKKTETKAAPTPT